jgi:hypothetical protein
MQFPGEVAAPAGVGAEEQARVSWPSCASRHSRSRCTGIWRSSGACRSIRLQPHHPGVGLYEAQVGARGLAAQPDAPFAGTFLPKGYLGVEQRKRQLFRAALDVDAGIGRFKIGQPDGLARSSASPPQALRPGRRRTQQRVEVPAAGRGAHQVQAGLVHADGAISSRPRHRESRRMDAVTVLACSTGSAP